MSLDPAVARRLILIVAVFGFILRLAFGIFYWVDKPLTHDEREYLALSQSLATGNGFVYGAGHETGTAQQFGRAPLYPLFLAAVGAGGQDYNSSPTRVKIAQSLVGALGVWIIGMIAVRTAGAAGAVAAAVIAACYPPLVWIAAYVLSETLYSTVALASVLILDVALDRAQVSDRRIAARGWSAASGIAAGLAILIRPAMLFFLPLAALWMARRRRVALSLIFVVTALAVVAPWTARNVRVFHRLVLVASEGGVTFWTGNHPLARGEGDLAANPDIKRAEIAFREARPGLTAEQLEPLYYRDALHYIVRHPFWWAWLLVRKVFYTVVPLGPSYTLHSMSYVVASVASYLLLLPLAAWGWQSRRHHRRPEALFVLAASSVLAGLVFFPQERFRIPVIDPALIVCAAAACADRWNR
jgi:4-amino-4-deoxy-L-arabinose transferase-like glycosyltransferase